MLVNNSNEDSSFNNYVTKFNSLEKRGKDKILPLLLKHFLQSKPEGGWNFVIKRNQDLTDTQKRIIHTFNLLGDGSRRKLIEKVAYYFLMMDIDYEFVLSADDDDETMTQFILYDCT